MNSTIRTLLVLSLGLFLGLSLTLNSGGVFAQRDAAEMMGPLPLEELRTFTEVFAKIKSEYVETVDDKTLLENAVRGMLSGLDPHSSYLDAKDFEELQVGTSGEFGGLGIEVGMEDGLVKVIAPIDDTPAHRAGVQAEDLIVRLDDTPVQGLELSDAVNLMRGKPGTDITLTIIRKGEDKPIQAVITRAIIKVQSVKSHMLEPGFGYLRISQFQTQTGAKLDEALADLEDENGDKLKGLILDLRNNPGGVLSAAVEVSDAFLKKGLIVYTEGRIEGSELKFNADPEDKLDGAPIVVLVNTGSASASEIVAGALQDHGRAIVMGSKTFGKGSVQTILPMTNDSALKLTTARYYTPLGRSIQAEGIEPDITLKNVQLTAMDELGLDPLTEANLSRHLTNGEEQDVEININVSEVESQSEDAVIDAEGVAADNAVIDDKPSADNDYQIHEALNLLKGLTIMSARHG